MIPPVSELMLASKVFIPPTRPMLVRRPRLMQILNGGLDRALTLISAPAGSGKTVLTADWAASCGRPAAWLSLDEGDNDPAGFLSGLIACLRTICADIGAGVSAVVQSSRPQPTESLLSALLDDIAALPADFLLVLDDYHCIEAKPVRDALALLLEHRPRQMHLAIVTREDPDLPLARLRARGQLTELRAADLRFSHAETAEFLNHCMGLDLPAQYVTALEARTEGWAAGLQLAAISLKGREEAGEFIRSFTGSNSFVTDFLMEEVFRRQPGDLVRFLLRTSVLDRFCGPLCDAVTASPDHSGQETLERLERANLFLVPLDSERRWYRYHSLFTDLLRQRLRRSADESAAELHLRASRWYEDNGMEVEAFRHAAAAGDLDLAGRLIDGRGMPLHFRGAIAPVLHWLESLPAAAMRSRPSLWVSYASALMMSGSPAAVEARLQAAEAALQGVKADTEVRDLEGRIVALRAMTAAVGNGAEAVLEQSRRSLELLSPDNQAFRTFAALAQAIALQLQGRVEEARGAFTVIMAGARASGNLMCAIACASSLGFVQETENQLHPAADTYGGILKMVGDPSHMSNYTAHLGLARISYEWNDLDAALQHGQQAAGLVGQIECESPAAPAVLLARVRLARGDASGAADLLDWAEKSARRHAFEDLMPEVEAARVLVLLQRGKTKAAAHLAEESGLPAELARVRLVQGDPSAASQIIDPLLTQAESGGPANGRLRLTALAALALHARGEREAAIRLLGGALALAQPGGYIRLFLDEGAAMAGLLSDALAHGAGSEYAEKLLAAFQAGGMATPGTRPPMEALSRRELEILRLIAKGFSNQEIAERLFISLSTVKGHNQSIFGKLQVQRRAEAMVRARELGLA
jgi:LuxR family transcriptional regulator, maltose regulon positive regulatory protein